jgi:hypothetical protein
VCGGEIVCDTGGGLRWQEMELQGEQIELHNVVGIRLLIDNENFNLSIKCYAFYWCRLKEK